MKPHEKGSGGRESGGNLVDSLDRLTDISASLCRFFLISSAPCEDLSANHRLSLHPHGRVRDAQNLYTENACHGHRSEHRPSYMLVMNGLEISPFIRGLPKVELHVHMEGTLTPALRWKLAHRNNVELPYATYADLLDSW
jgi:hypothetical protein